MIEKFAPGMNLTNFRYKSCRSAWLLSTFVFCNNKAWGPQASTKKSNLNLMLYGGRSLTGGRSKTCRLKLSLNLWSLYIGKFSTVSCSCLVNLAYYMPSEIVTSPLTTSCSIRQVRRIRLFHVLKSSTSLTINYLTPQMRIFRQLETVTKWPSSTTK